ncbi:hypothetical protein [Nocardioides sp. AE5]|uniref:hypothetical protein n=1 Tax=Nocardioides sp. AE5 TaxID=2962573 RepID=UPI00288120A6|nr:hypothetical protein [Nocardioides sp. AE5]MDT0201176.1 hypothetical protein [Nocardioides sp. AE5]
MPTTTRTGVHEETKPAAAGSRWPAPPVWLLWIAGAISLTGLAILITGAIRTGVTVDETFHTARLHNYLTHGWYLLDDDLTTHGTPGTWVEDRYVYGPITALLAHLANTLTGNETWTTVSTTTNAYLIRHLTIATIAIAGTTATATITRIITGTWRWALITTAILLSLPMWTGHAMFNIKDIPVATGYTLFTLACIHTLTHTHQRPWRHHLTTLALAYTGILLTLGTRPALWPGLGATGALLVLHLTLHRTTTPHPWRPLTPPLVATALALTTLALTYPNLYTNPHWLLDSATESAGYEGVRSWTLLPGYAVGTVPDLLLLLGVVGCLVGFGAWCLRLPRWDAQHTKVAMVAAQALLLPTLIWLQASHVSGGLRHVLFAIPAVAILITLGTATLMGTFRARARQAVSGVAVAGMLLPTVAMVQLFPYAYGYANVSSSFLDVQKSAPDFWQASLREYADDLPAGSFIVCGVMADAAGRPLRHMPPGGQSWLVLGHDCARGPLSVLAPFLEPSTDDGMVDADFVAFTIYPDQEIQGCEEIGRVTRKRLLTDVIMSRGFLCPLVLPPYRGPVDLAPTQSTTPWLLDGWGGPSGNTWITATGPASLGFADHLAGRDLQVRLTGTADGPVAFRVNNEPATARETADGWMVDVPGVRRDLGSPANVVITVVPAADEVRLTRMELER